MLEVFHFSSRRGFLNRGFHHKPENRKFEKSYWSGDVTSQPSSCHCILFAVKTTVEFCNKFVALSLIVHRTPARQADVI